MSRKAIAVLFVAMFTVSLLTSAVAGAAAGIMAVRSAPTELLRGQANNAPGTAPNNPAQPNTPSNPFPNGGFGRGAGGGAVVAEVVSGSPAEKAGLQVGDVIQAVNGTRLDTNHTLTALLQTAKPGDSVALSVRRRTDGNTTVNVTLGASPTDANTPYLGIRFQTAPLSGGSPTG